MPSEAEFINNFAPIGVSGDSKSQITMAPALGLKSNAIQGAESSSCPFCTSNQLCRRHVFNFLDSPTELRVAIYHKALYRDEPINLIKKIPVVSQRHTRSQRLALRHGRRSSDSDSDVLEGRVNQVRRKHIPRTAEDPLAPQVLVLCKQIYHEALPVLYRENSLNLHLELSLLPLTRLRQPTRSLIRHALITIYDHGDVLNGAFNNIFTNGLRYCFGLESLEIITKVPMPRDRAYDLNFHILRWLPKGCKVEVKGNHVPESIKKMIDEQNMLREKLDLHTYYRRQIQTYYMERGQQIEHFVDGIGVGVDNQD
ncbi:uncharacterized protein PV09_06544 [Verruconis gallopava]|uniref:DUF7730 domain-containing protein n=1 Tax=Verruconis gallopava TaxID=253628 RepID=A0A0D1YMT0_9PEZI|nr:uncharacterized protein PV09_06544 [Verruconis gallopava]KIW02042.1 hypothetical protein PV09_06544 [Verruconis gallopava]